MLKLCKLCDSAAHGPLRNELGYVQCNAQFLVWKWRRSWLCDDLHVNLGASAKERRTTVA